MHLQVLSEPLLITDSLHHLHPLLVQQHLLLQFNRLLQFLPIAHHPHLLIFLPVSLHPLPHLVHLPHPDSLLLSLRLLLLLPLVLLLHAPPQLQPIRLRPPLLHHLLLLLHPLIILSLLLDHSAPLVQVPLVVARVIPLLLIRQLLDFVHFLL